MRNDLQNYFVQGMVLIDVDGARLNNLGIDKSMADENKTLTKSIRKGRDVYAMVSGQAWRYWWREACFSLGWELSPITKLKGNQYVTNADPIQYPDDDIFGYMSAQSEETTDEKGKKKKENVTLTRTSPLKNSILVAVSPTKLLNEFSVMNRQDDTPALYSKEVYSTTLKGLFSLDMDQVGTYVSMNRSGYQNLSQSTFEALKNDGAKILQDKRYLGVEKVRMANETRIARISQTLQALKIIDGGAGRTTNYTSVKPDFIILCVIRGGSNPFDNIAYDAQGNPTLSKEAIKQVAEEYKEYLISDIYIGKATTFMQEFDADMQDLSNNSTLNIQYGSVAEMIDAFVSENIEKIINDME